MSSENQSVVHVYYVGGEKKCLVGILGFKNRGILFEYDLGFLKTDFELSPFKLPKKPGVIESKDFTFDGLFGVFNDSLPDGWGRLLLDRKLVKSGLSPGNLTPLDRLCFVGSDGMGALTYEPENPRDLHSLPSDLDEIAEEIQEFEEHDDDRYVEDLLILGGSSAGARPKALIRFEDHDWIVKFQSSMDPKDIGSIEYAYHLMAREAGLELPEARLLPSRRGGGYFGVKRFDRLDGKPIHMHSISGLLHADHRIPSLDYEAILKATLLLTRDINQCEKQFRAAVFNVLSHNRDDHGKNFSFLMDKEGKWIVSPAYDLTFSSGPGGEHCTMVMGEGKNPSKQHLLQLAAIGEIEEKRAEEIINEVRAAVLKWDVFSKEMGVGISSRKMIQSAILSLKP